MATVPHTAWQAAQAHRAQRQLLTKRLTRRVEDEMTELSPETANALREVAIAATMRLCGCSRDEAEHDLATGAVSVHVCPDREEWLTRWNAWYDGLSEEEEEAYHHEALYDPTCRLCVIREGLTEPSLSGG